MHTKKIYHTSETISSYITSEIRQIISKAEEQKANASKHTADLPHWLYLLSPQTGAGKTYSVTKSMGEFALRKEKEGSTVPSTLYMVHTTGNLEEAYRNYCDNTEGAKRYGLLLKNNIDAMIDFFYVNKQEIEHIDTMEEYLTLKEVAYNAGRYKCKNDIPLDSLPKHIKENVDSARKALQYRLKIIYKKLDPRQKKKNREPVDPYVSLFGTQKRLKTSITPLFPTANLSGIHAIFATTQKVIRPVWTLRGYEKLYELPTFKNGVMFIDEFDAQKRTILDILVKDAADTVVDRINLFIHLSSILQSSDILSKYHIRKEESEEIIGIFKEVSETFHANGWSFVYVDQGEHSRYIINSEIFKSVENSLHYLTIEEEKEKLLNLVKPGKDRKFTEMLNAMDYALNRLTGLAFVALSREREAVYADENRKHNLSYYTGRFLTHLIQDLQIEKQFSGRFKFLETTIMHKLESNRIQTVGTGTKSLPSPAGSFYKKGFSVMDVHDADYEEGVSRHSEFSFFSMIYTPEFVLKSILSNMYVFGISATATIQTVTRNFDLKYLYTDTEIKTLSEKQVSELNRLYVEDNRQHQRAFPVLPIDTEELRNEEIVRKYYANDPKAKIKVESVLNSAEAFTVERYKKYIVLYWHFMTKPKIKSFLVLGNAYPLKQEGYIKGSASGVTKDKLYILFKEMLLANRDHPRLKQEFRKMAQAPEKIIQRDLFFIIGSKVSEREEYRTYIQEGKLKKGKHAFVISVYAAMGAGRNIDYTVYDEHSGEYRRKDYDAIYCEAKTNLIDRNPGENEETSIPALLRLIYFIHALNVSNTITSGEFYHFLEKAVEMNHWSWKHIQYNNSEDYHNAVVSTIIQAIGRCHRANNPEDPLYLFIDANAMHSLAQFDTRGQTLLPSIKKVLEKAIAYTGTAKRKRKDPLQITDEIRKHSNWFKRIYTRKLEKLRISEKDDREYALFREHLLRHPCREDEDVSIPYPYLYTPTLNVARYWASPVNDFDDVEISLLPRNTTGAFIEISEEKAGLPIIRRIPFLRQKMEEEHIPISFTSNRLLVPSAFIQYKGELGEFVGKVLFEKALSITLTPIPYGASYFEFFDFVSDNDIFVDFKHYSYATASQKAVSGVKDEIRSRASAKLREIGAKKGIVVNLILDGKSAPVQHRVSDFIDGIAIVPFIIDASDPENPILDPQICETLQRIFHD